MRVTARQALCVIAIILVGLWGSSCNNNQPTTPTAQRSDVTSNTPESNESALGATGTIAWQAPLGGSYSSVRPVVGTDGTIYVIDVANNLTAFSPDGTVKWRKTLAGRKGLAIGADGTIYVGSEDVVRAYTPSGTLRWSYALSPYTYIFQGLSVGPDGNLYCVTYQGMGVFSLTPNGSLRWSTPEFFQQPIVNYGEVVFGPTSNGSGYQFYYYANHYIRAFDLNGNPVFALWRGGQPVISPLDGTFHLGDQAFLPDGNQLWGAFTASGAHAVLGGNGDSYMWYFSTIYGFTSSGELKFSVPCWDYMGASSVDPSGSLVLFAGVSSVDYSGIFSAYSTTGSQLWTISLPMINGINQTPENLPAFSPDGKTVYYVTSAPNAANLTAIRLGFRPRPSPGIARMQ